MVMAWIAIVPPSPRLPHERYQVRYQDGKRQRSAGIFPTLRRAEAERRAVERAGRQPLHQLTEADPGKARTLFGEYVTAQVVAGLEGPASRLRVRHPQEGREAHPVRLRRHPAWRTRPEHHREMEGSDGGRGPHGSDRQYIPLPARDHPQRRRRRRPAPVSATAQERCRPHRRDPQPAGPPPRGLAAARATRPPGRRNPPPATARWS
jgi:hypothetical protein